MTGQGMDSAAGAVMTASNVPIPKISREQQRRATAVALSRLGDGDCERLADASLETCTVLAALFQPTRKTSPTHSTTPPAERTAWLQRCRAWVAGQGYELSGNNVPREHQTAYVRATGDAYTGPVAGSRLQSPKPTVDEARAYSAKVREWARARGRFVGTRGTLHPDLVADYEAAKRGAK